MVIMCIHYGMEQETIIYFYPVSEQNRIAGNGLSAKQFWFQDVSLAVRKVYEEQDGLCIIGCAVPPFYFRHRPWRPQVLSEAIETVVRRMEGLTDTYLHPHVAVMLTEEYHGRWMPRRQTLQALIEWIARQYAARTVEKCGEAAVLLGEPADTEWQMEMTEELLRPYLSKINRLLIYYEEIAETDIWMELGSHLDEYYYEYGLVPQLEPYAETADGFRCGKHTCNGMILDYCAQFRSPKIALSGQAVYIDTTSTEEKEQFLLRKSLRIPYVSPLKYLDTMVKNSYDRLVN